MIRDGDFFGLGNKILIRVIKLDRRVLWDKLSFSFGLFVDVLFVNLVLVCVYVLCLEMVYYVFDN